MLHNSTVVALDSCFKKILASLTEKEVLDHQAKDHVNNFLNLYHHSVLEDDLCFFFGREVSASAIYDSALTLSCALSFFKPLALFCKGRTRNKNVREEYHGWT